MYKIGELSKLTNIPVKTLRFYDNEGILTPDEIDKFTGYRYYSASKIADCYRILALKDLGFTLEEIKIQLNISKDNLTSKKSELKELKLKTERRLANLQALYSSLDNNENIFNVVIRKSNDIKILFSRKVLDNEIENCLLLKEIEKLIPNKNLINRKVIIDYNTKYNNYLFDVGIGIELYGDNYKFNDIETKKINFGDFTACLICVENNYQTALTFINKYIDENGYQIVGPTYKIIYNDKTVEIKIPVYPIKENNITLLREDISEKFENDENAIGKYIVVDILNCYEQFNYEKYKKDIKNAKEIYFLPNGENFWLYTWTKGYLICHNNGQISKNSYRIKEFENDTFMFVEMKHFNFSFGKLPDIWVLKKIDSYKYNSKDIRITDNIHIEFINDSRVLGKWKAFDICTNENDYFTKADRNISIEQLFWYSTEFLENGLLINKFKGKITGTIYTKDNFKWTRGCIMDILESTVSKYFIKQFKGEDYLFIEWKSGDYKFDGRVNCYYIFKRGE